MHERGEGEMEMVSRAGGISEGHKEGQETYTRRDDDLDWQNFPKNSISWDPHHLRRVYRLSPTGHGERR